MTIVGIAFAVFGLYMLLHAVSNFKRAAASAKWPTVQGLLSEVRLWGPRLIDGKMQEAEKLAVKYSYDVESASYTGASPANYTLVYPETVAFAERHTAGNEITVYYNPKNPAESVLLPGLKRDKPYSELVLGAIAVIVGGAVAALGFSRSLT